MYFSFKKIARQRSFTKALTDADGCCSRPPVVLLANTDRGADEPVSQHALVDHRVPVAGAVSTDVSVDDRIGGVAVTGCGRQQAED